MIFQLQTWRFTTNLRELHNFQSQLHPSFVCSSVNPPSVHMLIYSLYFNFLARSSLGLSVFLFLFVRLSARSVLCLSIYQVVQLLIDTPFNLGKTSVSLSPALVASNPCPSPINNFPFEWINRKNHTIICLSLSGSLTVPVETWAPWGSYVAKYSQMYSSIIWILFFEVSQGLTQF